MIKIGPQLMEYANELERERGIPKEVILDSLKEAMVAAYKRFAKLKTSDGLMCQLIEKTGEIGIFEMKEVVKEYEIPEDADEDFEVTQVQMLLKEARKFKPDVEEGDILQIEVTPEEFGRIAAQSAKQVITQRIREAEKKLVLKEFEDKQGTVVAAVIQRIEGRNVVVNIGKSEAVLPPREQIPSEYYRVGNKLRVFVADLRESGRVPQIIVSQAHPAMVQEVFELEVPEIEDGLVEIMSVAREAGYRTKVAVRSTDPDVDAQGACIGTRGSRIQAIVNELKNEKIDIILWIEDPGKFITHALAPAKIVQVLLLPDNPRATVIVPDDQLSLAIGRDGQNVRLAAKLTGFKLDIKSQQQYHEALEAYNAQLEAAAEAGELPSAEAEAETSEEASAEATEETTETEAPVEGEEAAPETEEAEVETSEAEESDADEADAAPEEAEPEKTEV